MKVLIDLLRSRALSVPTSSLQNYPFAIIAKHITLGNHMLLQLSKVHKGIAGEHAKMGT